MLKPVTKEQLFLTKTVQSVEELRQLGEDLLLGALQRQPAADAPEATRTTFAEELRKHRKLVLEAGQVILKMRMAVSEGLAVADRVFSPTLRFDGLTEEQQKALKDSRKETEKEQSQMKKQESAGRGGGKFYNRGRGGYHYQPYQQPPYQQPVIQQVQPTYQQVQPAYIAAAPPAFQQQYQYQQGFAGGGQPAYPPDGFRAPRNTRPDSRAVARCYSCGTVGHFSKDGVCLPGAREAYQAVMAQGQMGQAGGQQAAITYMPSGTGGGN